MSSCRCRINYRNLNYISNLQAQVNMESRAPTQSNNSDEGSMKMRIGIDQQVISIVKTIVERCKKEKSNNCLQVPLEDCYERVSFYTGLPRMLVYHIIEDNPNEDCFDENDHIILLECINIFLAGELNLRMNDLYGEFLKHRKINNPDSKYTPDLKTFERKIQILGYTYKKNLKGRPLILIEDPELKFYRFNYLFKMKNFREKNLEIYYVDEKYILRHPFKYQVNPEGSSGKSGGLNFFHIISAFGYENGIFVSQAEQSIKDMFKKWMLDIVLYSIKPGSVIVMANNSVHGSLPTKSITRYHSKKHMLQWLKENDIPCDPNMKKPRLYELIEKCSFNNIDYDIDRVFKLHGHHVLRLPNNFPSLNPSKFLWEFINKMHFKGQYKTVELLRVNLLQFITGIPKQKWANFFESTCTMENRIFEIDLLTEDLLENNCELDEKCFYD